MSQHSSFKGAAKYTRHRSVLKRDERVKSLEKEGRWKAGDPVFSLPKQKTVRFKIKKEKSAEAKADKEAAAGETAKAAPAKGTAPAKGAAPAKAAGKSEKGEKKS